MFEWDEDKNEENRQKHRVSFEKARQTFFDPHRIIAKDAAHSSAEERWFFFGEVDGGILTVRFTLRNGMTRIFGAGYWRKGKKYYEEKNRIHR